jgi:DNA-binding transcriptional LysR family regulator
LKDIEFLTDPTAGELRIACSEHSACGPVFAAIDRLRQQHPRMVFDVWTGSVVAVHRELAERRVELAIHRTTESLVEDNMLVETLFDDDTVVGGRNAKSMGSTTADRACGAAERGLGATSAK